MHKKLGLLSPNVICLLWRSHVHMPLYPCEMWQVRSQLVAQQEEMSRLTAESVRVRTEHERELESRDRIMQDCLAAMQGEETAKCAAQSQLKVSKEQAHRLEQDLARHLSQLDDVKERCKDLEMERDEFQVWLCTCSLLHAKVCASKPSLASIQAHVCMGVRLV
jgi:hypothetical protein